MIFSHPRNEIVELIKRHPKVRFRVLDIGCGLGGTLQEIGNRYPRAELYGAEINQAVVDIASHYLNICCADIEQDEIPFETKFDYIIAMDNKNIADLKSLGKTGGYIGRLSDFVPDGGWTDVPDPYYTGNFQEVYDLVTEGCAKLLAFIRNEQGI